MSVLLRYDSNNSFGHWWLDSDDWLALEAEGWVVGWITKGEGILDRSGHQYLYDEEDQAEALTPRERTGDTWLGAEACSAVKVVKDVESGIREWERITGESASELGCFSCCGNPHNFDWVNQETGERGSVLVEATGSLSL